MANSERTNTWFSDRGGEAAAASSFRLLVMVHVCHALVKDVQEDVLICPVRAELMSGAGGAGAGVGWVVSLVRVSFRPVFNTDPSK